MKLTLSKPELLALVSKTLGVTISDITIVESPANLYDLLTREFRNRGLLDGEDAILPGRKIDAIKLYRTMDHDKGLAEAKYLVEHWQEVLDFIRSHDRYPNVRIDPLSREWSIV